MKENVRLSLGVGKVNVGNPLECMDEILHLLEENPSQNTDITLFPRLALSSPSSRSYHKNSFLLEQAEESVHRLREYSHHHGGIFIVGYPTKDGAYPVSALAIIHNGQIVAKLPISENLSPFLSSHFSQSFCDPDSILQIGELRCQIFTQEFSQLISATSRAAENQCNLLLVPLYEPMVAGRMKEITNLLKSLSHSLGMAIACVNGGIGDSSSPEFYHGFLALYENGKELLFQASSGDSLFATVDVDPDILLSRRTIIPNTIPTSPIYTMSCSHKQDILRTLSKNPFLPDEKQERRDYLAELFYYQTQALASRMQNTGIHKLVVGISGGIDSTAALMVAVAACDYLELPRTNVLGITLPGLGTSNRTYFNALALLEQLQVTRQDISIRPAILQHFEDIGHSGNTDTTYENAQARERTQILLDIANMVGGLVVGTGDLSEEALGFCTFGGDHLSNYNVNVCMTKTMLREILSYLIQSDLYPETNAILQDVLDTPISPELLPPSSDGEIQQITENILGPYVLHEFFLYYLVAYSMAPSKIYQYACQAFRDTMEPSFIKEKLAFFIKKFCSNQFKRSCTPDAAAITQVHLLHTNFTITSDLDPSALLLDLDSVK